MARIAPLAMAALAVLAGGRLAAEDSRSYLEAPINPRSGIPCPSAGLYSPLRPDPPGVPTVVGLAMGFQDISTLNDVDQSVTADVYVISRWRDKRLADPSRGDGSADCPVPAGALWMPAVEPENLRARQQFYQSRFLVDAQGTATLATRLMVQVSNPLDLRSFPFDRHPFQFTLWPTVSQSDEVVIHPLSRLVTITGRTSIQGWRVGTPVASATESKRPSRMGSFSRFDVTIELTRDWGYYALKLGVPLFLIVLMAYTVYFIPPSAVAQQIGVGMTAMLTLIAYMLTLGSSLPKISYLTRADKIFLGCAILVFLGLLKGILTTVWLQWESKSIITWTDRVGRWAYPVALIAILVNGLLL